MEYIFCPNCRRENSRDQSTCIQCRTDLYHAVHVSCAPSSLLLHQSMTLSSPLTLTLARQRLAALVATDPVISGSSRLAWMNERQYVGGFDGTALWLSGPFGYRKQSLRTEGQLQQDRDGVTLHLVLRMDKAGLTLVVVGLFCCLPVILTRSACMLPASLLLFTFLYAGLLLHFNTEAGSIKTLLVNALSERYEEEKQSG